MPEITVDSSVGPLHIREENGSITYLGWGRGGDDTITEPLKSAAKQLKKYFHGHLEKFDLPLAPEGTVFEKQVWDQMLQIPAGQTWTYGVIAKNLNSAARAVGGACGKNPIPIIIPCHRVVAAAGMGGYSGRGGLKTKTHLLELEGYKVSCQPTLFD
jgi:methylated-DNA-[protein]-cysteine S-methyltransferase